MGYKGDSRVTIYHIKIKKYIFRKHFQKKDKEIIKKCELYNKFFHVMSEPFSLYFSYSQGTDTKRIRDQRYNSMY